MTYQHVILTYQNVKMTFYLNAKCKNDTETKSFFTRWAMRPPSGARPQARPTYGRRNTISIIYIRYHYTPGTARRCSALHLRCACWRARTGGCGWERGETEGAPKILPRGRARRARRPGEEPQAPPARQPGKNWSERRQKGGTRILVSWV